MDMFIMLSLIVIGFLLAEDRHSSEDHDKSISELRERIEKLERKDEGDE